MGRRSINTTKSGKYMNPTDQARKEARKRELRKNKKQRMLVRTAVLKGKDPFQIIADMERLDQMEYNVNTPPPLNEKVLKDKRRKMKETWDRLCRLYSKEDHDRFRELKRMEIDYESKRNQMIKFYESVKSAQEVAIDDIPLPAAPMEATSSNSIVNKPLGEQIVPQSILKRHNLTSQVSHKAPPGVPPGPPPVLSDIEDDFDDDYDSDDDKEKNKKIRFNDEPQTNDKDSDINEFLKEIEQMEKSVNINENLSQTVQSIQSLPTIGAHQSSSSTPTHSAMPPPPSLRATNVPSGPPPPSMMMFRPPGPPQSGIRSANQANIPGMIVPRPGMPGPPPPAGMRPGMPPHRMSVPLSGGPRMMPGMRPMPPHSQSTTFVAPPTLSKREDKNKAHFISDRATIEAKPQLRNLSADATRFTPVALRVKRDDKVVKKSAPKLGYDTEFRRYTNTTQNPGLNAPSKDDAYDQFMKEMENLI